MFDLSNSTALSPVRHEHALGRDRWMVWAPDAKEPERVTIGRCLPSIEQMDFAIRLGRALNKHANEGGTWLVSWSEPLGLRPTRLAWAWIDRDGDISFTVDTEEGMAVLGRAGVDHYARQGHDAWREYHEHIKATEISPKQMIRRRQGERAKDAGQIVPWDFG